jgi:glyoxylase-like metal-dependent hydrolase (beta-lactamase superfamily II)
MNPSGDWREVGPGVFAGRYAFLDQQIGAILTDEGPIVIDTRTTLSQAREVVADLRSLTPVPAVAVVNTHHHFDHAFGNVAFRPAPIWAHIRCAERLRDDFENDRADTIAWHPELEADLRTVAVDLPRQTFDAELLSLELGGRSIDLRHGGRGHTDNDVFVVVPDAAVIFSGDLVIAEGDPYFGDAYPLEWPDTLRTMRGAAHGTVVPGHGPIGDVRLIDRAIAELDLVRRLSLEVAEGALSLSDAITIGPYSADVTSEALARGTSQATARSRLDVGRDPHSRSSSDRRLTSQP